MKFIILKTLGFGTVVATLAILIAFFYEPAPPDKTWRVEVISQQGEVMEAWLIEKPRRPHIDYSHWSGQGRVWGTNITAPAGWLIKVTEERE